MKRPDALVMLIELSEKASDERARSLGNALRRETSDQKRLQLLLDYRGEYLDKYQKLCGAGISTASMRNFQQFLGKLDVAIAQQTSAHSHSQTAAESARAALQDAERKRQSFVVLRDRKSAVAATVTARKEQKQHDEWAIQRTRGTAQLSGGLD
jgi:flagellar protein FliJ